jgi:hypothetical protein
MTWFDQNEPVKFAGVRRLPVRQAGVLFLHQGWKQYKWSASLLPGYFFCLSLRKNFVESEGKRNQAALH